MREKMDKQSAQKLAAGIFTGAMVLLCAALYFFTGGAASSGTADARTAGSPAPMDTPDQAALAPAAAFVEGKSYYSLSEDTGSERVYLLSADEAQGTLTLSVSERGVGELVLSFARPPEPEAPASDAAVLAGMLYRERLEKYRAQKAWLCAEAAALLAALNPSTGLGAADREAFLFALDSTISDGKSRDLRCNNISVQLFCYNGGEGAAVVSASVLETENE
ncbi:MAG: hypothetical protein ABFC62_04135 [Clostridiaceae bacterium]|nr:hypothetical protein [Eubacteriales bacterium]